MKKQYFSVEEDGFYGVYYPLEGADRCFIVMLGDSSDDHLTHFAFPERMLRMVFPVIGGLFVAAAFSAAKKFPRECRQSRIELDKKLSAIIRGW